MLMRVSIIIGMVWSEIIDKSIADLPAKIVNKKLSSEIKVC